VRYLRHLSPREGQEAAFLSRPRLLLALIGAGCTRVQPIQRELLSDPMMQLDSDPREQAHEQHWIETNVFCPCNCRHLLGSCGGECAPGPEYRKKVHDLLMAGKTRQEVIDFLGGSAALASPPKTGVQRLAWAIPYVLGAAGAAASARTTATGNALLSCRRDRMSVTAAARIRPAAPPRDAGKKSCSCRPS